MELGIFRAMEVQMREPAHPMQLLARQFRKSFMKQYEKFVVPSTSGTNAD
jgi:hypothetical protein